jgi:hypothetical protein
MVVAMGLPGAVDILPVTLVATCVKDDFISFKLFNIFSNSSLDFLHNSFLQESTRIFKILKSKRTIMLRAF